MSLVSSMIPLFVFITLPGVCPSTLGFKNYLILENQQVTLTWEEFFKVVGIKKAIKLANCFYAYFYAYSASPSKKVRLVCSNQCGRSSYDYC